MADDLIIKFFREDLTETEESALSDRLSSSIEDALRFGQHAEAAYRHYGLPEPAWRGGEPPTGFLSPSGFKLGLWLPLAFLAGMSAWGAWKYWPGNETKPPGSVPVVSTWALSSTSKMNGGHTAAPLKKAVIPDQLDFHSGLPTSQTTEIRQSLATTALVSPALTPLNAMVPTHHPHSNLEVLVKRAKPGEVTVRVLGPDGAQAVMLYQGMLQPGSWAFDWNGRLADGGAPPGGTYQIQVVSGAVTLSKNVVIKK